MPYDFLSVSLTETAKKVLERRYFLRDEEGRVTETLPELFQRVARSIASADRNYGKSEEEVQATEQAFFEMISNLHFLAGMCLYNAGKPHQLLSACFVLPVEDSMDSIFETLRNTAILHKFAGGVGYSFSRLRPKGDRVSSTGKPSSGPISFMRLYDFSGKIVVGEAAVRRPANMGILRVDHPDILDFITAKKNFSELNTFNISVGATDEFMNAFQEDRDYSLINPRTKKEIRRLRAKEVFDFIVQSAHSSAEPGMIFLDNVNRENPIPQLGPMEATNPCGEQPLFSYESCNLGSINLAKMLKPKVDSKTTGSVKYEVDWEKLRISVRHAVHFLDNTIDVSYYPIPAIKEMNEGNRRIGLGIMGFADMLVYMGIPYNSDEACETAEKVMEFVTSCGREASVELGKERGSFLRFHGSLWQQRGYTHMRNCTVTTIAPTGTTSILANCSSGCEPIFALAYVRKNILDEEKESFFEVHPLFEKTLKDRWLYSETLMERVVEEGSVQNITEVPEDIRRLFVTANDISYEWHVKIQAAFQRHTDNGVSKTINMPNIASVEDIGKAYLLAWKLGCKGVTVYRDASRDKQVLNLKKTESALVS
jgi:ribonucleoside-diphosphate reductase alpha chain